MAGASRTHRRCAMGRTRNTKGDAKMTEMIGHNSISNGALNAFIERIEDRERDKRAAADDVKDETWRVIPSNPNYEASSLGRIRCAVRRRYLKPGDIIGSYIGT